MIQYTKDLFITAGSMPPVIKISQYSDDFTIVFNLIEIEGVFALESGTTAEIRGTKTDGNGYSANATIDIPNKTVTVSGHKQMTAVEGKNVFELVLRKGEKELATANFILLVEPAAMDAETVPSESVIKEIDEAVDEYFATHDIVIDPTLSISGRPADAKATGDAVVGLKDDFTDLIGVTINKGVVKNQYVNNAGGIIDYNGWDRTRYICVKEWKKLKVTAPSASNYNCFYDANKAFIYAATAIRTINIVSGENEIVVPPNAYYAIFSGTAAYIENLVIEGVEKDCEYQDKKNRDYIQTDLYGKQALLLGINDITIGYKIAEGEVQAYNDRVAITNSYYPLANPHNKYHFDCSGYNIFVYEYSKDGSGTYTFIKSTKITSSGTIWASTKTTHIKFYFETVNSNVLIPYTVADFCDKFIMREQNELNKYLRVCTFNQAANYPHFMSATEEDLNKRVVNYLNFIGEYNPDVLCAQEAVATYFQPVSYQKSTQTVFDRKYFYMYQSGYQRKTWSKYQYTDNAMVTFQSQAEGDSRFYGKQTIHVDGKEIVVLNTHCAYQGESDFDAVRKGQFEELVVEMQQHEYCVCCGDFNAWSAYEFDVFKEAGFTCANCGEYGVIDTWYVGTEYPDWPFKAVDNIITTNNIVLQNVLRGPYDFDYFSDHAPLIADLQIR